MAGNCTFLGTQISSNGEYFYEMYKNLTFGQFAESVIFNLLSNALEYRIMTLKIQKAEDEGNNPLILQETISFLWKTIWFTNVYYAFDESQLVVADPRELDLESLRSEKKSPKVGSSLNITYDEVSDTYEYKPYKFWYGLIDRYADYFEYYSETQECNRWLQIFESRIVKFRENYYPNQNNSDGTVFDFIDTQGTYIADSLRISHNLTQTCLTSVRQEIILD